MLGKKQENINSPIENIHERDLLPESALFPLSGEFRAPIFNCFVRPDAQSRPEFRITRTSFGRSREKTRVSTETIETSRGQNEAVLKIDFCLANLNSNVFSSN